ncbi:MAG: PIN domain-containing protein [Candidatus Aenigmatarchaeota archaeon]
MILDTSFIIDLLRNNKEAVEKAKELDKMFEPALTTTVSVFELWQGLKESGSEKGNIRNLLTSLGILSFDLESALLAGDIQRELVKKGDMIEPEDSMIAGIVLKNNETILARNVKHFRKIPELKIETY